MTHLFYPDGKIEKNPALPIGTAVYSGSFNPLHKGHIGIFTRVADTGRNIVFEISQKRVGKPDYTEEDVWKISEQFAWKYPLLVSSDAPLYFDKFESLKQFCPAFVMGYDTLKRFCEMTNETLDLLPDEMKIIGFGRLVDNVYHDPRKLKEQYEWLEDHIVEFHDIFEDISSSQIRQS